MSWLFFQARMSAHRRLAAANYAKNYVEPDGLKTAIYSVSYGSATSGCHLREDRPVYPLRDDAGDRIRAKLAVLLFCPPDGGWKNAAPYAQAPCRSLNWTKSFRPFRRTFMAPG